jgi:hypothetical protein
MEKYKKIILNTILMISILLFIVDYDVPSEHSSWEHHIG